MVRPSFRTTAGESLTAWYTRDDWLDSLGLLQLRVNLLSSRVLIGGNERLRSIIRDQAAEYGIEKEGFIGAFCPPRDNQYGPREYTKKFATGLPRARVTAIAKHCPRYTTVLSSKITVAHSEIIITLPRILICNMSHVFVFGNGLL